MDPFFRIFGRPKSASHYEDSGIPKTTEIGKNKQQMRIGFTFIVVRKFGGKNQLPAILHTPQMSVLMVFRDPHLPLAFHFVCGPGRREPQKKLKASGLFLFIWLRRRRRTRYTVQIVVFVQGPLLETIVLYVTTIGIRGPQGQQKPARKATKMREFQLDSHSVARD